MVALAPRKPQNAEDARKDALMLRVAQGDDRAMAELYKDLYPMLYSFFTPRLSIHHDREDLIQETLLKAFKSAPTFDPEKGAATAWVWRIANSKFVDHLRKIGNSKNRVNTESCSLDETFYVEAQSETLLDQASQEEALENLRMGLNNLPETTASAKAVKYLMQNRISPTSTNLTFKEAAELHDVPLGSFKSTYHRTSQRLREDDNIQQADEGICGPLPRTMSPEAA